MQLQKHDKYMYHTFLFVFIDGTITKYEGTASGNCHLLYQYRYVSLNVIKHHKGSVGSVGSYLHNVFGILQELSKEKQLTLDLLKKTDGIEIDILKPEEQLQSTLQNIEEHMMSLLLEKKQAEER